MSSSDLSTMNHMTAIIKMCSSKFRYGEMQQIKPLPCCLLVLFTVEFKLPKRQISLYAFIMNNKVCLVFVKLISVKERLRNSMLLLQQVNKD